MLREPEYPSGFGNDFVELSFLSGSLLGAEGQNEASLETDIQSLLSDWEVANHPKQKDNQTEKSKHWASIQRSTRATATWPQLLSSVLCFMQENIYNNKYCHSIWHRRQSEICLSYRKWTQLCTVKYPLGTTGQWFLQPGRWDRGRRDETINPPCRFSSLADRKLSNFWLDTYKETSKLFSFPLSWPAHSCYCLQPTQDPARTHFSSESDHWQIATPDIMQPPRQSAAQ